jgi:hypothetical protein
LFWLQVAARTDELFHPTRGLTRLRRLSNGLDVASDHFGVFCNLEFR